MIVKPYHGMPITNIPEIIKAPYDLFSCECSNCNDLRAELAAAKAENERLRKACEMLAETQADFEVKAFEPGRMPGNDYWSDRFMVCVNMARKAIAPDTGKDGNDA